jgi:hypothetical protein
MCAEISRLRLAASKTANVLRFTVHMTDWFKHSHNMNQNLPGSMGCFTHDFYCHVWAGLRRRKEAATWMKHNESPTGTAIDSPEPG